MTADVQGLAVNHVNTERGTMSNVHVNNNKNMRVEIPCKLMKGVLQAIHENSRRTRGTTINVTPKEYDIIIENSEYYTKLLAQSDLESETGFKVTSICGFCKKTPLLGTRVMVNFKKIE